jgi:hypothetical protein
MRCNDLGVLQSLLPWLIAKFGSHILVGDNRRAPQMGIPSIDQIYAFALVGWLRHCRVMSTFNQHHLLADRR